MVSDRVSIVLSEAAKGAGIENVGTIGRQLDGVGCTRISGAVYLKHAHLQVLV